MLGRRTWGLGTGAATASSFDASVLMPISDILLLFSSMRAWRSSSNALNIVRACAEDRRARRVLRSERPKAETKGSRRFRGFASPTKLVARFVRRKKRGLFPRLRHSASARPVRLFHRHVRRARDRLGAPERRRAFAVPEPARPGWPGRAVFQDAVFQDFENENATVNVHPASRAPADISPETQAAARAVAHHAAGGRGRAGGRRDGLEPVRRQIRRSSGRDGLVEAPEPVGKDRAADGERGQLRAVRRVAHKHVRHERAVRPVGAHVHPAFDARRVDRAGGAGRRNHLHKTLRE